LVEGEKNISMAKDYVEFVFGSEDTPRFDKLVSTQTPQDKAAVARIPNWSENDVLENKRIVVLDTVQDPGNVGTIVRLCLAFDAGLILLNSADLFGSKVIRSSAGAVFATPAMEMKESELAEFLSNTNHAVFRLENKKGAEIFSCQKKLPTKFILIAGSEGKGITLKCEGISLAIKHNSKLESLNVASALSIVLSAQY
jgi:TrmH family RNA methyltransferase